MAFKIDFDLKEQSLDSAIAKVKKLGDELNRAQEQVGSLAAKTKIYGDEKKAIEQQAEAIKKKAEETKKAGKASEVAAAKAKRHALEFEKLGGKSAISAAKLRAHAQLVKRTEDLKIEAYKGTNRYLDMTAEQLKSRARKTNRTLETLRNKDVAHNKRTLTQKVKDVNQAMNAIDRRLEKSAAKAIAERARGIEPKTTGKGGRATGKSVSTKDLVDGNDKVARSFMDSANAAAAFRAALNATGTSMGIYTGHTIVVAAAVFGMVAAIKSAIMVGTQFTTEMTRAIPIMGANAEQAAMLETEVRRLGSTTQFTATEAAEGLTALAMAGLTTNQAMQSLSSTLALATIGNIDLYKSSDILTNVMMGFRMEASQTSDIADDLATAITTSNSTIEQMANALSYVAPVASAAGGQIEEVTAMLEVFHNAGIKGSRAGTSLRRAYSNLMAPSEKQKEVMRELGIVTGTVNGGMLELSNIMNQLADNGATTADMIKLFGVRASPAMIALLNDMKGVNSQFEMFRANLEANEGAAESLTAKFKENLGKDAKQLVSALQEVGIQMFEVWEEGLRGMVQGMTEFVRSIDPETIKNIAKTMQGLVSVIGTLAQALVSIVSAKLLISLYTGMTSFSAASLLVAKSSAMGAASISVLTGKVIALRAGLATLTRTFLPLAAVSAVVYGLMEAWDYYSDSANKAAEATKKLNDQQMKLIDMKAKAVKNAEALFSFVEAGGGKGRVDAQTIDYNERVIKQEEKLKQIAMDREQLFKQVDRTFDKEGIEAANKAYQVYTQTLRVNAQQRIDAEKELLAIKKEQANFEKTGLTADGIRQQKRFANSIAGAFDLDFEGQVDRSMTALNSALSVLDDKLKNRKITVLEQLFGSRAEVEKASKTIKDAFQKDIQPLLEVFSKGTSARQGGAPVRIFPEGQDVSINEVLTLLKDPAWLANVNMTKAASEAAVLLIEKQKDLGTELQRVDAQLTNNAFDKYINGVDKLQQKGKEYLLQLQQQKDKLLGLNKTESQVQLDRYRRAREDKEAMLKSLVSMGQGESEYANTLREEITQTKALEKSTWQLATAVKNANMVKSGSDLNEQAKARIEAVQQEIAAIKGVEDVRESSMTRQLELKQKEMQLQLKSTKDADVRARLIEEMKLNEKLLIQLEGLNLQKENATVLERSDQEQEGINNVISTLELKRDKLLGVEKVEQDSHVRKVERTLEYLKLEKAKAIARGDLAQADVIANEIAQTIQLKDATVGLLESIKALEEAKAVGASHEQGKGLSEIQKIEDKYSRQIEMLNEYAQHDLRIREGLMQRTIELEQEKHEAISEFREKRLREENDLYFQLTDLSAEAIGKNISETITMAKTWEEASANIKKAIVGGIIGTLVEVGIKEASLSLAKKIFTAQDIAQENLKAGVKLSAETAKQTAVAATAASEAGASASSSGLITGLVAEAAVMSAAWWPVATAVSLATMGANSVPAMAGIAATSAMATAGALMTGLAGGVGGAMNGLSGTREIGGPVMAGHSYLVGEKGAEVFTPTVGGQITSNADVNRAVAGTGSKEEVHNHYYTEENYFEINAIDSKSFKETLSKESDFVNYMVDKARARRGKR